MIERYHYLGDPKIVGPYLKQMARLDGRPVACLGWGSAAWKVACRDNLNSWDAPTREADLHKVVNNLRFLILSWLRLTHLAPKLLAANTKIPVRDWHDYYRQPPGLAGNLC